MSVVNSDLGQRFVLVALCPQKRSDGGSLFPNTWRKKAFSLWLFPTQELEERLEKVFGSDVKLQKSPKETVRELIKRELLRGEFQNKLGVKCQSKEIHLEGGEEDKAPALLDRRADVQPSV